MGIDLRWTEGNSCKLYKTYISKVNCHSLAFSEDACRLDREMMSFTKRSFKSGFQSRPPTLSDEMLILIIIFLDHLIDLEEPAVFSRKE